MKRALSLILSSALIAFVSFRLGYAAAINAHRDSGVEAYNQGWRMGAYQRALYDQRVRAYEHGTGPVVIVPREDAK